MMLSYLIHSFLQHKSYLKFEIGFVVCLMKSDYIFIIPVLVAPVDVYPQSRSHCRICSISRLWPAMISFANFTSSGCLDTAIIFAISTAPWWCGIIPSRKALSSASPVLPAIIVLISAILIDIISWDIFGVAVVLYFSQPRISGIILQCSIIGSIFFCMRSCIIAPRRDEFSWSYDQFCFPSSRSHHLLWDPRENPRAKATRMRPTAIAIRRAAPQLHQVLEQIFEVLHAPFSHSQGSHLQSTQAHEVVFLVTIRKKKRK